MQFNFKSLRYQCQCMTFLYFTTTKMTDVDLFNKEQRPTELCYDCLEFGEYLMSTWKIDLSDELYEARRDEQVELEMQKALYLNQLQDA